MPFLNSSRNLDEVTALEMKFLVDVVISSALTSQSRTFFISNAGKEWEFLVFPRNGSFEKINVTKLDPIQSAFLALS